MVAAPFKATINFSQRPGTNEAVAYTLAGSASDVANAFMTNTEDGLSFFDLPRSMGPLYLHPSTFLSAAGTDTTQLQLFVNGQPTGTRFQNAAIASAANVARVAPIGFQPGTRIAFKQLA